MMAENVVLPGDRVSSAEEYEAVPTRLMIWVLLERTR